MWHRESLGRNIFMGEVEVPLDTWDWDSEPIWLPLQPRVRQLGRLGKTCSRFPSLTPPGFPPACLGLCLGRSFHSASQPYLPTTTTTPRWPPVPPRTWSFSLPLTKTHLGLVTPPANASFLWTLPRPPD